MYDVHSTENCFSVNFTTVVVNSKLLFSESFFFFEKNIKRGLPKTLNYKASCRYRYCFFVLTLAARKTADAMKTIDSNRTTRTCAMGGFCVPRKKDGPRDR